jgi:hypothetical protein
MLPMLAQLYSWLERICRCLEVHEEDVARLGGAE